MNLVLQKTYKFDDISIEVKSNIGFSNDIKPEVADIGKTTPVQSIDPYGKT